MKTDHVRTIPITTALPSQVWALRRSDGGLLPPMDDDGCDEFMAFPTEGNARLAAKRQMEQYDVNVTPVRLK